LVAEPEREVTFPFRVSIVQDVEDAARDLSSAVIVVGRAGKDQLPAALAKRTVTLLVILMSADGGSVRHRQGLRRGSKKVTTQDHFSGWPLIVALRNAP